MSHVSLFLSTVNSLPSDLLLMTADESVLAPARIDGIAMGMRVEPNRVKMNRPQRDMREIGDRSLLLPAPFRKGAVLQSSLKVDAHKGIS